MAQRVSFREALRVWTRIGLLSFGGPSGQIALMHRELVAERKWISEPRFLHALNYCMLLPGPEAQQLAVYIGWLMHRTLGGLAAGLLFIVPGFLAILALSIQYAYFAQQPWVAAAFVGLKAAVLAVVLEAMVRVGKRSLRKPGAPWIAAGAFAAIFLFSVSFPWVVLGAALAGLALMRADAGAAAGKTAADEDAGTVIGAMSDAGELGHTSPSLRRALTVMGVCGALWAAPILLAAATLGTGHVLVQEGLFFSRAALVTFGGAYAVLAYVAQQAVEVYGWLAPGEMLDGLGMAETTPGPLILVLQFVGFLGAFRGAEPFSPLVGACLGAVMTVWVTFVPCFLWIFVGAPYVEAVRGNARISAALGGITAAVVGVIGNLTLWFAVHASFAVVEERSFGPLHLMVPDVASVSWPSVLLAALSLVAVFWLKLGIGKTLAGSLALGLLWQLAQRVV